MLVTDVESPRCVSERRPPRIEREESKVAVSHVAVLGAEQKTSHDWSLRVTVHDHYTTYNNKLVCMTMHYGIQRIV